MINRKRWPSVSPGAILLITLATAAAVLIGGIYLARRTEQAHVPGNRKSVQVAGEEMEKEFGRLQRLYEKHLRQLASVTLASTDNSFKISEFCNSIVGVGQWSFIHAAGLGSNDLHVPVGLANSNSWPHPTFQIDPEGARKDEWLLSREDLLQADGQDWGWIIDPGKPLLFWQRTERHDAAVILLIDPQSLQTALNPWLAQWARESFAPLRVRNGPLCALQSSGQVLMFTGPLPAAEPDFILPIRSPFGTWELLAWDRIVIHTFHDSKTLVIAGFLAAVIVLLGVMAFLQQRRLLAQTAQRVTFVNRVSHELRSPLTNILLNLDLARELLAEPAKQPAHRLALVQEEAHRLKRLVDNVLAFSSIEQRKHRVERRPCVPGQIIQAVIGQFASSFTRRGLTVDCQGDVATPCLLDADAVTQILSNLFSNIEKYVPQGRIIVSARLHLNTLVITVSDEGPGIPAREAERIFQPFERLDSRITEGASGTGLGLSIARDLSLEMGGSLRLVPSPAGASFELRVPAFPVLDPADSIS